MTFLLRGLHQWRLSTQTPPPQRTTHWHPPTPTTAATGTTPNPTTTPTPTLATTETHARPSPPLPTVHPDTHSPRTQDTATVPWSRHRARRPCPVSPQQRHRLRTAATHSRHPRLWWWPQTLPPPLPPWCAATALWASSRWWRPPTGSTRTPTPWARPRWSAWGRCPSWCPLRAEPAHWSESKQTVNMGWSSPLPFTATSFYVSLPFYLKTNWDFTVQSSFNANSLMERSLHFSRQHGIRSSRCWMCSGNCFQPLEYFTKLKWISHRTWIPRSYSGLDLIVLVFLKAAQGIFHLHPAWWDGRKLGYGNKCMCPLFQNNSLSLYYF